MIRSIPYHLRKATVTIQQAQGSQDSGGGPITTYTDLYTNILIQFNPTGGAESRNSQRMNSTNISTAYINVADAAALDTTMRIKYGGRYFNIVSANNMDEQGAFWTVSCVEVNPE